jgi:serine/threonine protein kinase
MELVKGRPLGDHAKAHGLNLRQRLDLMARVCDAVDHAHQRGVIHRDLKPGNILVDEQGQPKVLDFGVARAVSGDLHAMTMQTGVGQLIGTLQYMSPEQIRADPAHIDRRSDVYALGVILFELLLGRHPHELAGLPLPEAARRICDDDPQRAGWLERSLRGDVEIIIAKSLEKGCGAPVSVCSRTRRRHPPPPRRPAHQRPR